MLRTYETIYVTNPDVQQENLDVVDAKLKSFITSSGGEVGHEESWGVRDLAYSINKQSKGRYQYMSFTAEPAVIKDIEFYLKISEPVLTYMTVKMNEVADLENLRKPNPKNM